LEGPEERRRRFCSDSKDTGNSYESDTLVRDVIMKTQGDDQKGLFDYERTESLLSDDNETLLQNNRTPKWHWISSILEKKGSACCHVEPTKKLTLFCQPEPSDLSREVDTSQETMSSGDTGTNIFYDSQAQSTSVGDDLSSANTADSLIVQLDNYDNDEFISFLQYLADRTKLSKLEVYRSELQQDAIRTRHDVALLSSVIRDLSRLQEITLHNFGPESNDLLTQCLKDKPLLHSIRLHYLQGSVDEELLQAIAHLPSLTDVVVDMPEDFPFYILFSSESLKSLKINGTFTFDRKSFEYAMLLLCTNVSLEALEMQPLVPPQDGVRSISYAVEANATLESLYFSFQTRSKVNAGDALLEITKALSRNCNLKEVVNYRAQMVHTSEIHRNLSKEFLEPNKTLTKFEFYNDGTQSTRDSEVGCGFNPPFCQTVPVDSWMPHCGALGDLGL
jgi:hypothetical protein